MGVGKFIYIFQDMHKISSPPSSNLGTSFSSEVSADVWKGNKETGGAHGVLAAELHVVVVGGLGSDVSVIHVRLFLCLSIPVCRQQWVGGSQCFSLVVFYTILWLWIPVSKGIENDFTVVQTRAHKKFVIKLTNVVISAECF